MKVKRHKERDEFNVEDVEQDYSFENMKSKDTNPYDENRHQNRNNSNRKKDNQIFQDPSIRYLKSKR